MRVKPEKLHDPAPELRLTPDQQAELAVKIRYGIIRFVHPDEIGPEPRRGSLPNR